MTSHRTGQHGRCAPTPAGSSCGIFQTAPAMPKPLSRRLIGVLDDQEVWDEPRAAVRRWAWWSAPHWPRRN